MTSATITATATRPQQLDEELRLHLHPSVLPSLSEAVELNCSDEIVDCLCDLTEDLKALAEEFPKDWQLFCGSRTPAAMAAAHLGWLIQQHA
jgi:hypothetical protein